MSDKTFNETAMAVIHLNVPATLKAEWVKQSRDAGLKLGDWIVAKIYSADKFCGKP